MNKSMEYMAFELPVVAFDLHETRVSAGDAGIYVEPNEVREYAKAIVDLMDDEPDGRALANSGASASSKNWPGVIRSARTWGLRPPDRWRVEHASEAGG